MTTMKVSDIILYIIKIIWWGLKGILLSLSRDLQKKHLTTKFWIKLHLDGWGDNSLIQTARNDITGKLHSEAT